MKKLKGQIKGLNPVLQYGVDRLLKDDPAECLGRLEDDPNKPIPDIALDKHARAGRAMGRGFDHFFKEGAKLVNPDGSTPEMDQWWEEAEYYFKKGYFDKKHERVDDQSKASPQPKKKGVGLFSFVL